MFSQKGFIGSGRILGVPYELTRRTNYIEIPILFQFKPIPFLTIVGGPQYSFLIKQRDVYGASFTTFIYEDEFNDENIRKSTLGFLTGLDINIKNFVLGARVGWDFMNNNGNGATTTPRYKNVWS
ncbi:MAG: outer membrane beta-barrel protein [Bacteroidales bacterium]|nr:outer membrane beta-barrel protein [Bacteroidales bacterium]